MLGQYWYHGLTRKYVSIFGTIFNDIILKRKNSSGNVVETLKVPLAYGPKQKFFSRISGDPKLDKSVGMQLPRMGFEMTSMSYSPERMLHPRHQQKAMYKGQVGVVRSPVAYDYAFTLAVFVKNADDGTQIVEQIVPFFQPDFTVSINALPTMGIKLDIPIILNGVNVEDSYEGDYQTRRAIVWTFDFTLKGYLYPNIKGKGFGDGSDDTPTALIRTSMINFHILPYRRPDEIDPERILLESHTGFGRNKHELLNEDDTKMLLETTRTDINATLVKSRFTSTIPPDVQPGDDYYEPTHARDFFAEGLEWDPKTGTDTMGGTLDINAFGNTND